MNLKCNLTDRAIRAIKWCWSHYFIQILVCDDLNLNEVLEVAMKTTPEIKNIVAIGTDRKDLGCIPMW